MKMRTRAALGFFISSPSNLRHIPLKPTRSFLCLFSSLSSSPAITTNSSSHSAFVGCLQNTYKFTRTQALSFSNRFSSVKSPDKPQTVHKFFRELGFSETQIRSVVRLSPRIMFSNVDKNLRPKIEFFQQLGVDDSDLGKFISKNPGLLRQSLKKILVPYLEILKKIFGSDANNRDFIRVFKRDRPGKSPQRLLANCAFLESIGIVGPRLSLILKMRPLVFSLQESKLRELVLRVSDLGFSPDSKMFIHGLQLISTITNETIKKKLDLLSSLGFSEDECMKMFRKAPFLASTSEEKLKFGIEFYLYTVGFRKSLLITSPYLLGLGMKQRVIPRYKVFLLLKLKKLFKREPNFFQLLRLSEGAFLEKFILRFRDDAEELLVAYKGHISDSSDEDES